MAAKLIPGALGLLAVALSLGCAAASGSASRSAFATSGTVVARSYVFGAFGRQTVDIRDVCASGRARELRVGRTVADYVVSVATVGMVLPHHVTVLCEPKERP